MGLFTQRWDISEFRAIIMIYLVSRAPVSSISVISLTVQVTIAGRDWLPVDPCNNDGENLRKK
jgi:hypothetical protein